GRDCAPFSRSRGPHAHDEPGNGIDEDCDGADTPEGAALPSAPTFWGELPADRVRRYDVVWFVIDALRADHTGAGGYSKPTTPYLDDLAKESWFFTHALSQSSATMLSFPSMLTGVDPGKLEWRLDRGRLQLAPGQPFLSERFGSLGYTTGFVAAEYFEKRLPGLLEGWSEVAIQDRNQRKSSSSSAAHAASFISRARTTDAPFFLMVYLPAPHAPYVDHPQGYPKFGNTPAGKYDAEIANADRYLGFVLDVLRSDPARYKRTIIIATGDHGEEFGEHGGSEHANTCHHESVHVPLVVRIPDEEPQRIDVPVGLIDVTPALLELVGAPAAPGQRLDGNSLLLAKHAPDRLSADRPFFCSVVSQKAAQGDFFRRAVRSGKWALFKEMRGSQAVTLYDVEKDPAEQAPVSEGGDADAARTRLDTWLSIQLTGNVGSAPLTGD
ncbi:MAG: sulfatase, partial [Polyangiaceae bacterium]|nr:sulfatase [Polyangiaceae bacterium]